MASSKKIPLKVRRIGAKKAQTHASFSCSMLPAERKASRRS